MSNTVTKTFTTAEIVVSDYNKVLKKEEKKSVEKMNVEKKREEKKP